LLFSHSDADRLTGEQLACPGDLIMLTIKIAPRSIIACFCLYTVTRMRLAAMAPGPA